MNLMWALAKLHPGGGRSWEDLVCATLVLVPQSSTVDVTNTRESATETQSRDVVPADGTRAPVAEHGVEFGSQEKSIATWSLAKLIAQGHRAFVAVFGSCA